MNEHGLVLKINKYLSAQPDVWHVKIHGHAMQRAGLPDYILCVAGSFAALEAKHPTDRSAQPTVRQEWELSRVRAARGVTKVVRSVAEVEALVDSLRESHRPAPTRVSRSSDGQA